MKTRGIEMYITGRDETDETWVKKQASFLIFKVEWWERISVDTVGSDIIITSEKPIRHIYLNGELYGK